MISKKGWETITKTGGIQDFKTNYAISETVFDQLQCNMKCCRFFFCILVFQFKQKLLQDDTLILLFGKPTEMHTYLGILRPSNIEMGSEILVISEPKVDAGLLLTTLMFLLLRQ